MWTSSPSAGLPNSHALVLQVMVFVHARNATVRTAMALIEMAKNHGEICFFQTDQGSDYGQCEKQVRGLNGMLGAETLQPFASV